MKKSAILSIALMSVLLLTGCKKNKNSNKKGDVVNDLLLKANTKEERKYIYSSYNLTQNEILLENIADIDYSSGFLIITTEDTRKTFYSVTTNKFLESDLLISDYVAYSSNVTGGFLKLTLDGLTTIYDALGNTLVDHSYESYSLLKINSGISGLIEMVVALALSYGLTFVYVDRSRFFITRGTVIFFISLIILIILTLIF